MITGGFIRRSEAENAILSGVADAVGLARALVIGPSLPVTWRSGGADPTFPRFTAAPPSGITAWSTMRLTDIGEDRYEDSPPDLDAEIARYEERDEGRSSLWIKKFGGQSA